VPFSGKRYNFKLVAAVAQLVERNLAKVEVESSRLFSRSRQQKGKPRLPFFIESVASDTGAGERPKTAR
jgi:predicted metalloprotease